jgi:hypothetical protein
MSRKNILSGGAAVAAFTAGIALTGVLATTGSAFAAETNSTAVSAAHSSSEAKSQGWIWTPRQALVFSAYGGPTTIGSTADELIYAYCQHDGTWGFQTYAWVPSLSAYGWIRNGDITGFTGPIAGLDYC